MYAQSHEVGYTGHRNTIKKKAYTRRLTNALLCLTLRRGVHPSEAMMHFPPCFRCPPIFEKYSDSADNFQNFPEKEFLDFHLPKFLMTFFLVIDHKFQISPYFPCFSIHFPLFRENYYFPLL